MFKKVLKTVEVRTSSLRELSRSTGVSHSMIARIEKGFDCRLSTAKKLLVVLDHCPCCGNKLEPKS